MAWPKGRPRLTEEQRAARHTRDMYDMTIESRHGEGKAYGCGEAVTTFQLLDVGSYERAKQVMAEHKKTCWSEKKHA